MEEMGRLIMSELLEFYKDKKVLVTGHTGFKGSWLCRILVNAGAEVTGYSLEPPTEPNLFSMCGVEDQMNSIIGDIRDREHLSKVFEEVQPEIVLHLAAQPIVRDSYKDPVYTYETNVMGTVNICECVRQNPCVKSFLNVTTDKVYKNNEWEWGYRENEPLDGYDPYSNSKSCSELVTHSYINSFYCDMEVAVSTARAGNVIGGGDFANDRIIPDCVRAAGNKKDIPIETVGEINIMTQMEFNTSFLNILSQNGIMVHCYNYYDYYIGSFYPKESIISGELLVNQVNHYTDSDKRLKIAQKFIDGAADNIYRNVRYYNARGKDLQSMLDDIDNIIGVLHIKEVLALCQKQEIYHTAIKDIKGLIREVDFIPETRNINTLFTTMQNAKTHIVIVVDEYGQTSGIVAMEDILEEIVGNIEDEHDQEEKMIEKLPDGSYLMDGMTSAEEALEILKIHIPEEDEFETLNGILISLLDRIPNDDEKFETDAFGYHFEVLQVENKMIKKVKITKLAEGVSTDKEENSCQKEETVLE